MGNRRISLNKRTVCHLYREKRLSPYRIADQLGCSFSTITNRLREWGVPLRTKAQAQMRYPRHTFSGNRTEAAYMLGFRVGDLNVYKPFSKNSETIVARCHTTDAVQVILMKQLFSSYGKVQISQSFHGFTVNCYLDDSFLFLLPKEDKVEAWIRKNELCRRAFFAGYTDAEGNFIINQGRARFKIDSYDSNILTWAHHWLCNSGIRAKLRRIAVQGQSQGQGMIYNADLWRLNINEAHSLKKFIDMLSPHLKHKRRLQHARAMSRNIMKRIKYGTV